MLEVQGISKSYGGRPVLDDISFRADEGESVCITGPNGCGKTTLLRILSGALYGDRGRVSFFGHDSGVSKGAMDGRLFRRYIGYVPQTDPVFEELTVLDNLRLYSNDRRQIEEGAALLGLTGVLRQSTRTLSGGTKRRISLAAAMMGDKKVLIMDEPTSGLDIEIKEQMREIFKSHLAKGGIIVMASHDRAEIEEAARVIPIKEGRICI